MILDKNRIYDGWDNLAAGMDSGRRPSLIDPNQCAVARDTVFRGGVPKSRPGIRKLDLIFQNDIHYDVAGPSTGPDVLTDASIVFGSPVLTSVLALFRQEDIGTLVTGTYGIPDDTTIVSVEGPTSCTMSNNATETSLTPGGIADPAVITRPPVGGLTGIFPNEISAPSPTFVIGDVGGFIRVEWFEGATFHSMPDDTTILTFIDSQHITVSHGFGSVAPTPGVTITFIDEVGGPELVVTLVGRSRTSVIDGAVGTFPNTVTSLIANFGQADLGQHIILNWFEGMSPNHMETTIASVIDTENILIAHIFDLVGTIPDIQLTMPARITDLHGLGTIDAFKSEPFQCASYYTPANKNECIMATFGGRLFQITPGINDNATVREVALGTRNRSTVPLNYMVQADKWHITQDGEAKPIIFDGVTARRAGEDEIIVGQIMAYGLGRLVVTRGTQIYFGDLFGSHPGDPSDSILKFTETNFLSEGFPAEIPYTLGEITAVAFFPAQDTATGQGELVVFTGGGAVSFDLHLPRDQWKSTTFQQIALINSTARGHRAVTMVNADLWIRSDEGWRAYRQARAQATGWYQLPQSTEVSPWTNADTPNLLRYASAISFNNRLIVTCNPIPNQGRLYHDGILSLDFDVLSGFGQATRPAWDGHWGKLKTLQLVTGTFSGQHRAFAFGLDENNVTQLYEISAEDREDFDGPITSEVEFRSHNFNSPFNEKQLYGADIWADEIAPSALTMELSFRPDSSSDYVPWKTVSDIRPPGTCGEVNCGMCPTIGNGFVARAKIGKPSNDCDEYSGRLVGRGFEFQPKLRWTGHAAIRRMRLQAMQIEEDPKGEC